ncbi:MAG: hypothetical protein HY657_18755 [Acidobacteria bacterium]|nr:hypothetical protein [Acidobacteriota bacterium]
MASRREFLQLALAASAVPLAARGVLAAPAGWADESTAPTPLYAVVFDERYPASRAFAGEAKRLGLSTRGIGGDVTRLWFDDLDRRWRQEPAAIAGLTTYGALFCLDVLARDYGMRTRFRADHYLDRAAGRVEHVMAGPAALLRDADTLMRGQAAWGRGLARVVTRHPASPAPATRLTLVARAEHTGEDPAHLVSWVISPWGPPAWAAGGGPESSLVGERAKF